MRLHWASTLLLVLTMACVELPDSPSPHGEASNDGQNNDGQNNDGQNNDGGTATDGDGDGVADDVDNCPGHRNTDQTDTDGDGFGDTCDGDDDDDLIPDIGDNCPLVSNLTQTDEDEDGVGDACDPNVTLDRDGDQVPDDVDNCPDEPNRPQADTDRDGLGNVCDPCLVDADNDADHDGVCADTVCENVNCGPSDNCALVANADQADTDGDGHGDACDDDDDDDGRTDLQDNCPLIANVDQADQDLDRQGDACDEDADGDDVEDIEDNCPEVANADQLDSDRFEAVAEPIAYTPRPATGFSTELTARAWQRVTLPFPFDFFGQRYETIHVHGDGIVTFDDPVLAPLGPPQVLPNPDLPNNLIGLWDELEPSVSRPVRMGMTSTSGVREYVIAFLDVPRWRDPLTNTFQIVLREDHTAEIHVGDVLRGEGLTVGVEGPEGLYAVTVPGLNGGSPTLRTRAWRVTTSAPGPDGVGDACDLCASDPHLGTTSSDGDGDGIGNECDNCPELANADQADVDLDGVGDACDACLAKPPYTTPFFSLVDAAAFRERAPEQPPLAEWTPPSPVSISAPVPIGFGFEFFGQEHTEVGLGSNGVLYFGGDRRSTMCCQKQSLGEPSAPFGILAALWSDRVGTDPVRFETTGQAPDREFTVYYDYNETGSAPTPNRFRVTLHEADDSVEVHVLSMNGVASQGVRSPGGSLIDTLSDRGRAVSGLARDAIRIETGADLGALDTDGDGTPDLCE